MTQVDGRLEDGPSRGELGEASALRAGTIGGAVSDAARHLTPLAGLAGGAVTLDVIAASDPGSTRLVYAMVAGLAVVGIGFIGLGIWLIRRTRVEPPVLGPLERMGERDWKKRDLSSQRRLLDEVRPPGAVPLRSEPAAPTIDTDFDRVPAAASLADLGPGVEDQSAVAPPPEPADPTPSGTSDDFDIALGTAVESVPDAAPEADSGPDADATAVVDDAGAGADVEVGDTDIAVGDDADVEVDDTVGAGDTVEDDSSAEVRN